MKSKKILVLIITLIIVVLAIGGAYAYLMLNSTPEKIFTASINKVFNVLKSQENEMTTLKGEMKLSANVESEDEEIQAISDLLETSSIILNMAIDTENKIVNENIDIVYEDESILDATILFQEEKGYVYLPDLLDKYLEIPEEELDFSDFEESFNKIQSFDKNLILNSVQTEILNVLSKKEFKQTKNGQIKSSILDLSQEQFYALCKEVLENVKQNIDFNNGIGDYKEDIIKSIEEILEDLAELEAEDNSRIIITINTEGILNKFRGFEIELKSEEDVDVGISLKVNEVNYDFSMYSIYEGEKEEILKVKVEDKKENKNKGTATITINISEEEYIVVYKYENIDNQTKFKVTTEIDSVIFEVIGTVITEGKNIAGKLSLACEQEEMVINLNVDYNFAYNVEIQKTNIDDAVLIDEMTEEDQEELINNLQESKLYELVEQSEFINGFTDSWDADEDEPVLKYNGKTVKYIVPDNYISSEYNMDSYKLYVDEEYNSIAVLIEENSVDEYLEEMEEDYILTSDFYKNQELGEITNYNINGKNYKYRTITYNNEYASYVNLYFVYELEDGYSYVVKVESEGGQISLSDIDQFLDITMY